VRTLIDWHHAGEDIDRRMPLLSTLLGHVDPASTYWYYSDSRVIPMPAPSRA
jgi:integrase/recombinase XerD